MEKFLQISWFLWEWHCCCIAMGWTDLTPAFFRFESFTAFRFYLAYVVAVCMILAGFKVIIFTVLLRSCCLLLVFVYIVLCLLLVVVVVSSCGSVSCLCLFICACLVCFGLCLWCFVSCLFWFISMNLVCC